MNIDCNQINQALSESNLCICNGTILENLKILVLYRLDLTLSMFIPMLGLFAISLFRPYVILVKLKFTTYNQILVNFWINSNISDIYI